MNSELGSKPVFWLTELSEAGGIYQKVKIVLGYLDEK
jgi:hypothetical protein